MIRSGIFDREPVVKVIADNCYDETLHVITDEDYRPYSFYDEKGNFSGHDVELIALIANKLHMNLDLKPMKWNDGIAATLAGEAQVLMTCDYSDDFAGTDALIKSDPMSMDAFTVYSKKKISSVNDIYNERISVMANGNVTALIKSLGLTDNCTFYGSNREAMLALVNDEVAFTIMRNTIGTVLLNELGCKKIAGYMTLGQSYMCFGINGSHPELVERIDKALHEIKASGELEKLNHKWLTTFVEPYSFQETVTHNIWLILAFLTIFALMSYALHVRGQRQAEAELRAKEHLEMANKAKTEFLFNMSHDIRTPMNAIIGFTDIARKNIDDKARVQDCLKKIEDSGAHLIDLINEVLDMSRLEAGKINVESELGKGTKVTVVLYLQPAVDRVKEKGTGYYDCVLMDIQMPLMNGYEATKQLRTLPSSDNLIIIALSANAFEDDRKASCVAGMNDHLAKPIGPDELSRTLARYLKGE